MTFLDEWFNNSDKWFNSNYKFDLYLTNKYEYLLNSNSDNIIENIIIYDQLTRHIFRNTYSNHIILYFLQKALNIINLYKYNNEFINNLNDNEFIFFMLPLRHSNIKENIFYVLDKSWNRKNINKKFLIATYKNAYFNEKLINIDDYIHCFYNSNVLDYNPIDNIINNNKYLIGDFNIINNYDSIIVSLSGGVDSMVCLKNCMYLFPNIKLSCVHINYNNRSYSNDETLFISYFCYKYNIKLYVRNINEINRNLCIKNDMREIYENYTKKIRFNSYKSISDNPIVILGHNKDDCFENIITNITYNNHYDNLEGMDIITKIDNITFVRPLLNISKKEIYKFAIDHNIPYVKNSTPEWCQRGKIRDNIIPCLNNFDNNTIKGFFNLSYVLKDLYNMIDNEINIFICYIKSNYNMINTEDNNLYDYHHIDIDKININKLFWKGLIFKLFNLNIKNKSLNNLIERLNLWIIKFDKYDINKFYNIIISNNIILKICKNKDKLNSINFYKLK